MEHELGNFEDKLLKAKEIREMRSRGILTDKELIELHKDSVLKPLTPGAKQESEQFLLAPCSASARVHIVEAGSASRCTRKDCRKNVLPPTCSGPVDLVCRLGDVANYSETALESPSRAIWARTLQKLREKNTDAVNLNNKLKQQEGRLYLRYRTL